MRRNILKELKDEVAAMRAGKAPVEEYTGREAAEMKGARGTRAGKVRVAVSRATFAKLTKVARNEKLNVSELIDKIAKGLK